MKKIVLPIVLIFFLVFPFSGRALNLSDAAEMSVLTCGPSKQVHALYGHTAIRVQDPQQMLDVVFNYGVFSFSAPNFVYRFAKGKTDYLLATERFDRFVENYKRSGRSIDEQVLNLKPAEKQQMLDFLIWNAKPENREYRYNFFYDNCATRVRDVVGNQVEGELVFPEGAGLDWTFRKHVNEYQKVLPWVNFGIHLTLGSPSDETATAWEEMFLPDFIFKHFATAQIRDGNVSRPLVKETRSLFQPDKKEAGWNPLSPGVVLTIFLFVVLFVSYRQFKSRQISDWPDYILLFVTGLIGLVLLWFVTFSEHPAMQTNYNLWWAVPANLPFMFLWMVRKWRPALLWYWKALSVWLMLFFLFNFIIPQAFPLGFYLITLMVLCRALLHSFLFFRRRQG